MLLFHPDKLKGIIFSSRRLSQNDNLNRVYFVGSFRVKSSSLETDLGVDVDPELKFNEHIKNKVTKANRMVGAIRRSFRYLNHRLFTFLYKSMVRCHLETAVQVWSPSSEAMSDLIEDVQRKATQMLPNMGGKSYPERLTTLKLPTLRSRRLRGDMILTWKILHSEVDREVCPDLPLRVDQPGHPAVLARLHPLTLHTPASTSSVRRGFFTERVVPVWNSLPPVVKDAASTNSFKNALDAHWSQQAIIWDHKAALTGVRWQGFIVRE